MIGVAEDEEPPAEDEIEVGRSKIPLLYKVRSLGKNDRRSDVTGFGCKNGSKSLKPLRRS